MQSNLGFGLFDFFNQILKLPVICLYRYWCFKFRKWCHEKDELFWNFKICFSILKGHPFLLKKLIFLKNYIIIFGNVGFFWLQRILAHSVNIEILFYYNSRSVCSNTNTNSLLVIVLMKRIGRRKMRKKTSFEVWRFWVFLKRK